MAIKDFFQNSPFLKNRSSQGGKTGNSGKDSDGSNGGSNNSGGSPVSRAAGILVPIAALLIVFGIVAGSIYTLSETESAVVTTLGQAAVNGGHDMSIFAKKYKVDYCGEKFAYKNAKDEYRAGEKVTHYYWRIATDTDYSFWLDGAELSRDYDAKKGFILSFTMPEHDVTIHCSSRNTMLCES